MKKILALSFAVIAWYAVIEQYILMMENRVLPVAETTIRFFSYFTILTNLIVAVYLTSVFLAKGRITMVEKPGTLTAITVYITLVGLTYQVLLRNTWNPQGLQRIVDELLHSVVPVLVIIYWSCYEKTKHIRYAAMLIWAIYPLVYFVFVLLRGPSSHFYPYPFVDVSTLGMPAVLINAAGIVVLFFSLSALFIFIGQRFINRS